MHYTTHLSANIKDIDLHSPPVIIRVNDFDEASANEFNILMTKAQTTGQKVVPVVIDSYGGQVYSLMSMISSIKSSKIPVATIVQGKAMSCGAILFSCGTEGYRFMDPDATVMIHDVSSMCWGKVEEQKASVEESDRLNDKIYTIMSRNCGKKDGYFMKLVDKKKHADWFLDAKTCKKHNLANQIRVPQFKVSVTVDMDFDADDCDED